MTRLTNTNRNKAICSESLGGQFARRVGAGIARAMASRRNTANGRPTARPEGAPQAARLCVTVLGNGTTIPCAQCLDPNRLRGSACGFISVGVSVWMLLISAAILSACSDPEPGSGKQPSAVTATPDPELGKTLFATNCKSCHGKDAMGAKHGPPLIHKIYEPGHHADFSFYRAVSSGVKSHHWRFGDMPKILGVLPQEVGHIIAYIRQEQRRAGIH